jgi:hypothetical protein
MSQHQIYEGQENGVHTTTHFQEGEMIVHKAFDAQPLLDYAKRAREATEGQRWGDGKFIGTIPMAVYAQIQALPDRDAREQAIMTFFRENQAFTMFDRALK